jgi:protein NrfC
MGKGKKTDSRIIHPPEQPIDKIQLSRRNFIKVVGMFTLSASGAPLLGKAVSEAHALEFPASVGYILVDSAKCQGCYTCMIACSLAHEGCVNLSLARIQVIQNPFASWPNDITINQCHHCVEADCVEACPTGALKIDAQHGNTRLVDKSLCVGCGLCVQACPAQVERPILAPDNAYGGRLKSRKCDLCQNAAHHYIPGGGGYNGVQVCAAVCPVDAIKFTTARPTQGGNAGYDFNLRDATWQDLGFLTS